MYGYICMYRGERHEVRTDKGTYAAQQEAVAHFQQKFPRRKVKGGEVSVTLAEMPDGTDYVQRAVN